MTSAPNVYLISGPLGVGKSTTAKKLAEVVNHAKYIEGDKYFHESEALDLSWDQRLESSWISILKETDKYLSQGYNVVVDFVIEEEFEWLTAHFKDRKMSVKYIVLTANSETLKKRLIKRDHLRYFDRSLVLLQKLTKDSRNRPYILETDNLEINQVVQKILSSSS